MVELIAHNPFPEAAGDGTRLHAVVLEAEPQESAQAALAARVAALSGKDAEDRYVLRGSVAYLHTPNGLARSRLADLLVRSLPVDATMRNWRTVLALRDLALQIRAS